MSVAAYMYIASSLDRPNGIRTFLAVVFEGILTLCYILGCWSICVQ